MENIFIQKILINKVRNIQNFEISLSETTRKHLIVTGKNGSGKTSLLEEMKWMFSESEKKIDIGFQKLNISRAAELLASIEQTKKQLSSLNKIIATTQIDSPVISTYQSQVKTVTALLESSERIYQPISKILIGVQNRAEIDTEYFSGNFIIAYFNAKRDASFTAPKGIVKLEDKEVYRVDEHAAPNFLQYIVNLKAQRSFARDEGREEEVSAINEWFDNFEAFLQEIFNDKSLRLEFDSANFTFNFIQKDNIRFDFNTLSDGYSAILSIVTELMMRMEKKGVNVNAYRMPGIVLIDEIETHLHIELQKLVLPFLIKIFPCIQFIVTTHSPFVISSIENVVVCDLEKRIVIHDDLSGYSSEALVESYFDSDKYSLLLEEKVARYEILQKKIALTDTEEDELDELEDYLNEAPKVFADELALKIQQIKQKTKS